MIDRLSLEHPLVQHCNLRCVNCDHGSPTAKAAYSDVTQFRHDLSVLSKVLRVGTLKLVGGEPLLHPELPVFLKVARESGIAKKVQVWTNGLLLHRLAAGDLDDCDDLVISVYPGIKRCWDPTEVKGLSSRKTFRVFVKECDEFFVIESPTRRRPDEIKATFSSCKNAHDWSCHSFADGFYFKCSRSQFMARQSDFSSSTSDGLRIEDTFEFPGRIAKYLADNTPLVACSTCLGTSGPVEPHRQYSIESLRNKK